jgi:hypothetical protein
VRNWGADWCERGAGRCMAADLLDQPVDGPYYCGDAWRPTPEPKFVSEVDRSYHSYGAGRECVDGYMWFPLRRLLQDRGRVAGSTKAMVAWVRELFQVAPRRGMGAELVQAIRTLRGRSEGRRRRAAAAAGVTPTSPPTMTTPDHPQQHACTRQLRAPVPGPVPGPGPGPGRVGGAVAS